LNDWNHVLQELQEMMDKLASCQAKTSVAIEALVKQSEETERLTQAVRAPMILSPYLVILPGRFWSLSSSKWQEDMNSFAL
jgi:hypothetical protein